MKKRVFTIMILCLIASCVFVGCSGTVTREELDKQYGDGVRLDIVLGEGGTISGQDNISTYFYFSRGKDNKTQFVEPGTGKLNGVKINKVGHFLEGWYTDAEFKNKWDFATRTEEDTTLYAKWLPSFRFDFYYQSEETQEEVKLDSSLIVSRGGKINASDNSRVNREGYTLLGLYKDLECTQVWDYSFNHPGKVENGEAVGTSYKVYTKWLEGDYTLVRTQSDFASINANGNYYLLDDIDFTQPDGSGNYYKWNGDTVEYSGTIIGNGHTVKGAKASFPTFGSSDSEWGIFRTLKSGAVIENIIFEQTEVVINDTLTKPRKVGLLAGIIENSVTLSGITLNGKITFAVAARPQGYSIGLIAGELYSSVSGVNAFVDIDNRLSGYVWRLDETDPTANEVIFAPVEE